MRPSAKELLKHKFIKSAKKISYLTELIEAHERWASANGDKSSDHSEEESHAPIADDDDGWDFGTVKQSLPAAPKPSNLAPSPSRYSLGPFGASTQSLVNSDRRASHMSESPSSRKLASSAAVSRYSDTRSSTQSSLYSDIDDSASQNTVRAIDSKYLPHNIDSSNHHHHSSNISQLPPKSSSSRSVNTLKSESILRDAVVPALVKLQAGSRSHKAQAALETLRRSFQIAEREVPGTSQVLFEEIYKCLKNGG